MNRTILITCIAACLFGCGNKEEVKPIKVAASAPEPVAEVKETEPNIDQQLAAMVRGHPHARKVCVDGSRLHSFFLDYGPLQPVGAEADGNFHGWIFIEKVEFYNTSNNTFFIGNQEDKSYVQVYPDVTGLTCKN